VKASGWCERWRRHDGSCLQDIRRHDHNFRSSLTT
jgi:hypothetical protein